MLCAQSVAVHRGEKWLQLKRQKTCVFLEVLQYILELNSVVRYVCLLDNINYNKYNKIRMYNINKVNIVVCPVESLQCLHGYCEFTIPIQLQMQNRLSKK